MLIDYQREDRIRALATDVWGFVFNLLDAEMSEIASTDEAGEAASKAEQAILDVLSQKS